MSSSPSRPCLAVLATFLCLCVPDIAWAATGCSLSNPEEDIAAFFPEMESYTTHYVSFERQSPSSWNSLPSLLGDPLDPVWETIDVPYALYSVNGPSGLLGYVFGVNQRGRYSNIQVIAAVDSSLQPIEIRLQKIRSPVYRRFQKEDFLRSLAARPLRDYLGFSDCYRSKNPDCDNLPIDDPTDGEGTVDFRAILRGLAKLHLISELLLKPGEHPDPPNREARAEWIGIPGGPKSAPTASRYLHRSMPASLRPQSLLLDLGNERFVPIGTLRNIELVRLDGAALVAGGQGEFRWLANAEGFVAANRTLFGEPLLKDIETGSLWSLSYAEAVVGARAGEPLSSVKVHTRKWEDLSRTEGIELLKPMDPDEKSLDPKRAPQLP